MQRLGSPMSIVREFGFHTDEEMPGDAKVKRTRHFRSRTISTDDEACAETERLDDDSVTALSSAGESRAGQDVSTSVTRTQSEPFEKASGVRREEIVSRCTNVRRLAIRCV